MRRLTAKEFLYLIIILVPVGILVFAFFNQVSSVARPKAANGFLDLSQWNIEKQGDINLNGEWNFYWNQLLDPEDFEDGNVKPSGVINVPGIWNSFKVDGQSVPAQGYATYMLDIKLDAKEQVYALNILTASNAYKLWVNGKLIASNGNVGSSEATSIPEYRPQVVPFAPANGFNRFILQVSNYAHCKGGAWLPIEIGTVPTIQHERDSRVILEMFLFGCLFILSLYHFSLYFLRRSDPSTLLFGLMCFVISIRSLLTGTNLINYIFPDMNWFLARKIEYILTFTTAPIYVAFSRSLFPEQWNKIIYKIIVYFGITLCLFVLVTPSHIYTMTSYVFTGYVWLVGFFTIRVFYKALRKNQDGAGVFLFTSLFFLLTIINDTLNQVELVHTGLYLSLGLFIVTFAQSFVLSSRSANAFRLTEIYATTFRKFVPAQFLDKIAKNGIESIRVGTAQMENITVLFSDIRSFTSLAENMTPNEVFLMLNEYLSYVEPPIRANNGYVDKYMGDGIMALFENDVNSNSSGNALVAALEMQKALDKLNEKRREEHKKELSMGIGLHYGQVIIGTLGGNERMDSTAIGDGVNLASRIEGMTKMYGVKVLVSEHTLQSAGGKELFVCRFVDTVIALGKNEPVRIWEVIGKRSDKSLLAEAKRFDLFNEAMVLFSKEKIAEAKAKFLFCLEVAPGDKVTELYLERCAEFLEKGGVKTSKQETK